MTAPTHSLSVRPEHLPVPPDWVLRVRVGSAATQQVASPRLTPGYRADRGLPGRGPCTPLEVRVSARDMNPTALVPGARKDLLDRLPEAERAVADREVRRDLEPTLLDIDEELTPALRALAHPGLEADELLLALGGRADQHHHAFCIVFHPCLQADPVRPPVHVSSRPEIALLPRVEIRLPPRPQPPDPPRPPAPPV